MITFSLRSLFALVSLVGIAVWALSRPTVATATVAIFVAIISITFLAAIAYRKRCSLCLVAAALCCCYLCSADGGIYLRSENYLPTEWLLSEYSAPGTSFDSGRRRSKSLALWTYRLCFENNHKDSAVFSDAPSESNQCGNQEPDAEPVVTSVSLPKMTMTTTTTVVTLSNRDDPRNRPFYIVGHCTFVVFLSLLVAFIRNREAPDARRDSEG
jgi:hypothetical protein